LRALLLSAVFLGGLLFENRLAVALDNQVDSSSGEARFEATAQRYWQIVRNRPRRGTAFDLWYRLHLDAGRLDSLGDHVRRYAADKSEDANAQLLLGLVYERRGQFDAALEAYADAERLAPDDYYPVFLRGQLLIGQSRPADAIKALSRTIELKPERTDVLEAYRQLGRLYFQQGRPAEAHQSWEQMAAAFPNDRRVLKDMAVWLTREQRYGAAIRAWERLADASADDGSLQTQARIEIAQLHEQAGQFKRAIELFDAILDTVRPNSWLAQHVRRRIEEAFVRRDDVAGWIAYFRERLKRRPDELESRVQLARALGQSGQNAEALDQYRAAAELAPRRRDIRETWIQALVRERQFATALEQSQKLADLFPSDADVLETLGELHLRNGDGSSRRAEQKAAAVWKRIAEIRPDDPLSAVRVAEIARRADAARRTQDARDRDEPSPLTDLAEAHYREAIRRAPDEPKYYEYLGEFLHALGRKSEAVQIWAKSGELPENSAAGRHRLAEVFASFGYLADAIAAGEQALTLAPDEFPYRDAQIRRLLNAGEIERALAHTEELNRRAGDRLQKEQALHRMVEVYAAANRIQPEIERLRQQISQDTAARNDRRLLALLLAEQRQYLQAAAVLKDALAQRPDDRDLLRDYARMLESAGQLERAAAQYQRLVELRPPVKDQVGLYEKIVELNLLQARTAEAQQAADRLLEVSPANLAGYRLRAEVAFQLGEADKGVELLRQAVQSAPHDIAIRRQLARSLAGRQQTNEALDHYWRCLELAVHLDDRLALISAMAALTEDRIGRERLIDELKRRRQHEEDPRPLTLCLVELLRQGENFEAARRELLDLLHERADDVEVLRHLAALAESRRDWAEAVDWQERLVAVDDRLPHLQNLMRYYRLGGGERQAAQIWQRILKQAEDETPAVHEIDRHLRKADFREALTLAQWALPGFPNSWRLHYRAGYAQFALGHLDEAESALAIVLRMPTATHSTKPQTSETSARRVGEIGFDRSLDEPRQKIGWKLNLDGGDHVVGATADGPQDHPMEIWELSEAREAYARYSLLDRFTNLGSPRPLVYPSRGQSLQDMIYLPGDQAAARIHSIVASFVIAERRQQTQDWIDARLRSDSSLSQGVRQIVQIKSATNRIEVEHKLIDRIIELLPDDPLPHVARLHPVPGRIRLQNLFEDEQARRLETVGASFEWLKKHRPDLHRELALNAARYRLYLGDHSGAADAFTEALQHPSADVRRAAADGLKTINRKAPGPAT
jgi:tetratricopeptide (TPR) repeat protein